VAALAGLGVCTTRGGKPVATARASTVARFSGNGVGVTRLAGMVWDMPVRVANVVAVSAWAATVSTFSGVGVKVAMTTGSVGSGGGISGGAPKLIIISGAAPVVEGPEPLSQAKRVCLPPVGPFTRTITSLIPSKSRSSSQAMAEGSRRQALGLAGARSLEVNAGTRVTAAGALIRSWKLARLKSSSESGCRKENVQVPPASPTK